MILTELKNAKLINPPNYVLNNLCLLSYGGSISYGVATKDSDIDLIGFYIPPREYIYQTGIYGFDKQNIAEVYTVHHIQYNGKSYDIVLYPIVHLFVLACNGNPSVLDFLMNDPKHIIYSNHIGDYVLQNREMFLSKRCVSKFMGFATSELASIEKGVTNWNNCIAKKDISFLSKIPANRIPLYRNHKYDTKHAGNLFRLLFSLDDLLVRGFYKPNDGCQYIKEIRNGFYKYSEIKERFVEAKDTISILEKQSTLRDEPDRDKIRKLLVDSIEIFFEIKND